MVGVWWWKWKGKCSRDRCGIFLNSKPISGVYFRDKKKLFLLARPYYWKLLNLIVWNIRKEVKNNAIVRRSCREPNAGRYYFAKYNQCNGYQPYPIFKACFLLLPVWLFAYYSNKRPACLSALSCSKGDIVFNFPRFGEASTCSTIWCNRGNTLGRNTAKDPDRYIPYRHFARKTLTKNEVW